MTTETSPTTYNEVLSLLEAGMGDFNRVLSTVKEEQLGLRLHPEAASAGFNLRHIAETFHSFARMFFGAEINIKFKTLPPGIRDTGEHTDLQEIREIAEDGYRQLIECVGNTMDWETVMETRIGTYTKFSAVGRIIEHTAYHTGQVAMTLRYGK